MATKKFCDACGTEIPKSHSTMFWYIEPLDEKYKHYEFCDPCFRKVIKFIKSLRGKQHV